MGVTTVYTVGGWGVGIFVQMRKSIIPFVKIHFKDMRHFYINSSVLCTLMCSNI